MKLIKLTDVFRVGSSKRVLKADWKESGVPFYRGREITRLSKTGFADNELFISESHFAELSARYGVPIADDIMVTAIGTIGNTYIVNESDRFYFKDASVLWLHKKAEVDSRFIDYWLKSDFFFEQLDKGNGATVDTLTIEKLSNVELLLPSPEVQREIVEKLDRAFTDINLLEENFVSIESLINECDTSILGRVLNSNNGEVKGHRNSTLGGVTQLIARGISPTYLDSANTVVLNQRCIRNGRVDLEFSRHHDEKAKRVQEAKLLENGDGLINSTGVGTLGRTALFDHPGVGEFTVDSHVTIVRPKSDILDSNYFGLVLRALENVFVSLSTGTSGQTELPREAIKETRITFPEKLDDQKNFFDYYNSLNLAISEFREVLINKRVLAETLRASLLNSAFTEVEEVS